MVINSMYLIIQIQLMKSKYLDLNKFNQTFQPIQNHKSLRNRTKPKTTCKQYIKNINQTQSDPFQTQENFYKKSKFTLKKTQNTLPKSQKTSPKKNQQPKNTQNNSNNELEPNKQFTATRRQRSLNTGRYFTETQQQENFISELDEYLKDLQKSKLSFKDDQSIDNQTLLLKKLNILDKNIPSQFLEKTSRLQKKIKKEKSINRNMQKCIIEIQKVLWDRNDQLEVLQEEIRKQLERQHYFKKTADCQNGNLSKTIFFNQDYAKRNSSVPKQRNKNLLFQDQQSILNKYSKISQRQKPSSNFFDTNTETDQQSSATFKQKRPRRKTQVANSKHKNISHVLTKKGGQSLPLHKCYNKFQKHQLNDI